MSNSMRKVVGPRLAVALFVSLVLSYSLHQQWSAAFSAHESRDRKDVDTQEENDVAMIDEREDPANGVDSDLGTVLFEDKMSPHGGDSSLENFVDVNHVIEDMSDKGTQHFVNVNHVNEDMDGNERQTFIDVNHVNEDMDGKEAQSLNEDMNGTEAKSFVDVDHVNEDMDGKETQSFVDVNHVNEDMDGKEAQSFVDVNRVNEDMDGKETQSFVDVNHVNEDMDGKETQSFVDVNHVNEDMDGKETQSFVDVNHVNEDMDGKETQSFVDVNHVTEDMDGKETQSFVDVNHVNEDMDGKEAQSFVDVNHVNEDMDGKETQSFVDINHENEDMDGKETQSFVDVNHVNEDMDGKETQSFVDVNHVNEDMDGKETQSFVDVNHVNEDMDGKETQSFDESRETGQMGNIPDLAMVAGREQNMNIYIQNNEQLLDAEGDAEEDEVNKEEDDEIDEHLTDEPDLEKESFKEDNDENKEMIVDRMDGLLNKEFLGVGLNNKEEINSDDNRTNTTNINDVNEPENNSENFDVNANQVVSYQHKDENDESNGLLVPNDLTKPESLSPIATRSDTNLGKINFVLTNSYDDASNVQGQEIDFNSGEKTQYGVVGSDDKTAAGDNLTGTSSDLVENNLQSNPQSDLIQNVDNDDNLLVLQKIEYKVPMMSNTNEDINPLNLGERPVLFGQNEKLPADVAPSMKPPPYFRKTLSNSFPDLQRQSSNFEIEETNRDNSFLSEPLRLPQTETNHLEEEYAGNGEQYPNDKRSPYDFNDYGNDQDDLQIELLEQESLGGDNTSTTSNTFSQSYDDSQRLSVKEYNDFNIEPYSHLSTELDSNSYTSNNDNDQDENVNNLNTLTDDALNLLQQEQSVLNEEKRKTDVGELISALSSCPRKVELSPLPHSVTGLVVFPGALADWLRFAIEQLSGEPSDSLYNVMARLKTGDATALFEMPRHSVIHTHSSYNTDFDKAILLVTNPVAVEKQHLRFLPFAVEWRRYFLWDQTIISWLASDVPLLVLTADDLLNDPELYLKKIAAFLGIDEERVDLTCALLKERPILIDDINKMSGVYSNDRQRLSKSIDAVIETAAKKAPDILHRLFQYKTVLYM